MRVNDQQVTFNVLDAMKSRDDIEDYNLVSFMDFAIAKRLNSCYCNKEVKVVIFEELEAADITWVGKKQPFILDMHFVHLHLLNREIKPLVPSIESPLMLELKL